jgi:uncharacterized membrane protein
VAGRERNPSGAPVLLRRMTWYLFFKWVHVVASIFWVGGAFATQFYAALALRTRDGARIAGFAADAEWIGFRIFMTSSIVVFLAGIGLLGNGQSPWTWGMNFVTFGVIVFGASLVVGAGFLGPESGRLAKLIAAEGPESPAVNARIRRILAVSRVELVFLLGVVWAMVAKPVGNAGWFLGGLGVTAVVAVAVIAQYVATRDRAAAPAAAATD